MNKEKVVNFNQKESAIAIEAVEFIGLLVQKE
jgi:hypothetical protein